MGLFSNRDPEGPPDYEQGSYSGSLAGRGWACLNLSSDDKNRLINFVAHMNDVARQSILAAWPKGIDKEKDMAEQGAGGWDIEMKGYPWVRGGAVQADHDPSAEELWTWDKDSFIFRYGPPIDRQVFAVTFNEWDKLRLIDPPNDHVHLAFLQAGHSLPQGIHYAGEKEPGCYQFKLRGYPWLTSGGKEVTQARTFVKQLLAAFDQLGFELIATVDMYSQMGQDSAEGELAVRMRADNSRRVVLASKID